MNLKYKLSKEAYKYYADNTKCYDCLTIGLVERRFNALIEQCKQSYDKLIECIIFQIGNFCIYVNEDNIIVNVEWKQNRNDYYKLTYRQNFELHKAYRNNGLNFSGKKYYGT
jgi:hypothetical protein